MAIVKSKINPKTKIIGGAAAETDGENGKMRSKTIESALRDVKKAEIPTSTYLKVDGVLRDLENRKGEKTMKNRFSNMLDGIFESRGRGSTVNF